MGLDNNPLWKMSTYKCIKIRKSGFIFSPVYTKFLSASSVNNGRTDHNVYMALLNRPLLLQVIFGSFSH